MSIWLLLAKFYARVHQTLGSRFRPRGLGWLLRRVRSDHVLDVEGLRIHFDHHLGGCYIGPVAGCFDEPETHTFLNNVLAALPCPQGVLFIDVGANIGLISLDLARHVKVAQVVAFEPQESCVRTLRASAHLNGLQNKITIVPQAVTSHSGFVTFEESRYNPLTSRVVSDAAHSRRVPATTLDEEFPAPSVPMIMKIDVEGEEFAVLQGAARLLEQARPLIVFEYNHETRRRFTLDQVQNLLGRGYRIFRLCSDGSIDSGLHDTWNCVAVSIEPSNPFSRCAELLLQRPGEG